MLRQPKPFKRVEKYGAKRTEGYASKREAEYASQLRAEKASGAIADFLEQVPVYLPGRVRYVIDFMVINLDATVSFVEVKGMETEVWKLKMRQLAELHPFIWERLSVVK